jgi:glycosyltransferase involved in cell wall biosynthesis
MIKVVGIINHNNRGGAQLALTRLKGLLEAHRIDLKLCFLQQQDDGLEVSDATYLVKQSDRSIIPNHVQALWRLARVLRREKPDAVLAFLPFATSFGLTVSWFCGVRTRIASQRNPATSYSWLMRIADRIAGSAGVYTRNVMNSQATLDSFSAYPEQYLQRALVIYNGTTLGAWIQADAENVPKEPWRLVNIARLAAQKNQTLLIEAIASIPEARLVLVGAGPDDAKLRRLVYERGLADRVDFLGHVERDRLPAIVASAALVLHPSLFEGQSNALLESIATGRAIIASDIAPNVEALRLADGRMAGWVRSTTDVAGWVTAIRDLLRDHDQRAQLEILARKRRTDFSAERMGEAFAALIQNEVRAVAIKRGQRSEVAT